jgi:hypothetical protein
VEFHCVAFGSSRVQKLVLISLAPNTKKEEGIFRYWKEKLGKLFEGCSKG